VWNFQSSVSNREPAAEPQEARNEREKKKGKIPHTLRQADTKKGGKRETKKERDKGHSVLVCQSIDGDGKKREKRMRTFTRLLFITQTQDRRSE